VQSIATQTLRRASSPEEFTENFTGRVQALARAHTLFTRDSWQGTDITDLIRDQLTLDDAGDERIIYSGPRLSLDPQSALSFSMVLHELGTNARKYGALSVPTGRLDVHWESKMENVPVMLFDWVERGGPLVHAPLRHGFGTTLIQKGLMAHGGEAALDYDPEGFRCEIRLPLRNYTPVGTPLASETNRYTAPPSVHTATLKGKRILVIEDEPLVSMDIEGCLTDSGSVIVGPASSVERACRLIETEKFDAALVDANLAGHPVDDVAAALDRKGIPFLFLTGYGRDSLPKAYRGASLIGKPYTREQLVAATGRMVARKPERALQD
jgi:two-component sensor histidine kinase